MIVRGEAARGNATTFLENVWLASRKKRRTCVHGRTRPYGFLYQVESASCVDDGSRYPESARHTTPQGVHLEEFLRDEMQTRASEEVTDLRRDPHEIRVASSYEHGIVDAITQLPEIERSDHANFEQFE